MASCPLSRRSPTPAAPPAPCAWAFAPGASEHMRGGVDGDRDGEGCVGDEVRERSPARASLATSTAASTVRLGELRRALRDAAATTRSTEHAGAVRGREAGPISTSCSRPTAIAFVGDRPTGARRTRHGGQALRTSPRPTRRWSSRVASWTTRVVIRRRRAWLTSSHVSGWCQDRRCVRCPMQQFAGLLEALPRNFARTVGAHHNGGAGDAPPPLPMPPSTHRSMHRSMPPPTTRTTLRPMRPSPPRKRARTWQPRKRSSNRSRA